jgi:hypothetical protein
VNNTSTEIFENFRVVERRKGILDRTFIAKSLDNNFVFSDLGKWKGMHDTLIEKFKYCKVEKGEYLLKQNDNASSFFILQEGTLTV